MRILFRGFRAGLIGVFIIILVSMLVVWGPRVVHWLLWPY